MITCNFIAALSEAWDYTGPITMTVYFILLALAAMIARKNPDL
jgi:hypothetical protein